MKHAGTQTITTARLTLRRFEPSDAEMMYRNWASDDEVTLYLRWPTQKSAEQSRFILERWSGEYDKASYYHWGICLADGELIGSIGVVGFEEHDRRAELGYCIGRKWWGQGVTSEAVSAVVDYMFDNTDVERIEAYHSVQNPASGRVMAKAGMTREGFARHRYRSSRGVSEDCDMYGIIRGDWVAARLELVFPTAEHEQAALEFRQEHFDCGEAWIHGSAGLSKANSYAAWLEKIMTARTTEINGWVTASTYFAVAGGRIVGTINIRHYLNDYLLQQGGHIGYGVRPSERRKGYATQMLALALEKCRALGLERVLVTCDKDNAGSARTIEKNGGVLENEVISDDGGVVKRYWIVL